MVESVFVMVVLCLIFFTALEISRMFAGKEIINHAATAGVRARTVGFNGFMVHKVTRVATIPNAGPMAHPIVDRTPRRDPIYYQGTPVYRQWEDALSSESSSPHLAVERTSIPLYLGGESYNTLGAILDYDDWETVANPIETSGGSGTTVGIITRQNFPLKMPMGEFVHGLDSINFRGEAWHADHSSLYLE